jgi:hypothetical protein
MFRKPIRCCRFFGVYSKKVYDFVTQIYHPIPGSDSIHAVKLLKTSPKQEMGSLLRPTTRTIKFSMFNPQSGELFKYKDSFTVMTAYERPTDESLRHILLDDMR